MQYTYSLMTKVVAAAALTESQTAEKVIVVAVATALAAVAVAEAAMVAAATVAAAVKVASYLVAASPDGLVNPVWVVRCLWHPDVRTVKLTLSL